jgi:formiminotetrahydrofolate cyclodeaminase
VGSSSPTPGGGSTAAAVAALGAGLLGKVALVTRDKAGFAHRRELLDRAAVEAEAFRRDFLGWLDEDSAAYEGFIAAGRRPRGTREEEATYRQGIARALMNCFNPPLSILRAGIRALHLAREIAGDYYTGTASDLGLAAMNLKTAVYGARLTILINLKALRSLEGLEGPESGEGEGFAERCREEAEALGAEAEALAAEIDARVSAALL